MAEKTRERNQPTETGLRVLYTLAAVVIIVAGLRAAGEFLLPVLLGLFMAVLSLPLLKWLVTKGVPRTLAVGLTVVTDILLIFGLLFLAASAFPGQQKQLEFAEKLRAKAQELSRTIDHKLEGVSKFTQDWKSFSVLGDEENGKVEGVTKSPTEEKPVVTPQAGPLKPAEPAEPADGMVAVEGEGENVDADSAFTFSSLFKRYWDSKILLNWIGRMDVVGRLTSLVSKSFFVMIIMFFVLSESHRYAEKVKGVIRRKGPDLRRFQNSSQDLQKYLAIKTVVSGVTGLLAWLACSVIGVDFPILWGLVAFVFNYVPAIGSIVAAIPPALLAWVEHDIFLSLAVLGCYLVINIGLGNFVEPMLLGDRFGISTVVVILSVLFWGFVWGPIGMFLAVPLTMMVKVMLDNSTDLRWLSVMMSKDGDGSRSSRRKRGMLLAGEGAMAEGEAAEVDSESGEESESDARQPAAANSGAGQA